jgi:hypothetical protein
MYGLWAAAARPDVAVYGSRTFNSPHLHLMILCSMPYQFEESQLWNVSLVLLLVLGLLAWASCVMELMNAKECCDALGSSVKKTDGLHKIADE